MFTNTICILQRVILTMTTKGSSWGFTNNGKDWSFASQCVKWQVHFSRLSIPILRIVVGSQHGWTIMNIMDHKNFTMRWLAKPFVFPSKGVVRRHFPSRITPSFSCLWPMFPSTRYPKCLLDKICSISHLMCLQSLIEWLVPL